MEKKRSDVNKLQNNFNKHKAERSDDTKFKEYSASFFRIKKKLRGHKTEFKGYAFPINKVVTVSTLIYLGWEVRQIKELIKKGTVEEEKDYIKDEDFLYYTDIIETLKKEKQNYIEPYKITPLKEILDNGVPEIKWRIDSLVPERSVVIFGGTAGTRKTWIGQYLALCCSAGIDLFEKFKVKKCNVLYLDEENGDITLYNRFGKLVNGFDFKHDFNNLYTSVFNSFKLDNVENVKSLKLILEKYDIKLVICDSMVRCMTGEEDKSKDVRVIFDNLKIILSETQDIAFVILHHTTKVLGRKVTIDTLRGSGDFSAFADVILMFNSTNDFTDVEIVKHRHIDKSQLSSFSIKFETLENEGLKLTYMDKNPEQQSEAESCIEAIREWYKLENQTVFRTETVIAEMKKEGYKKNTIHSALNEMITQHFIKRFKRGSYEVKEQLSIEEISVK